MELLRARVYSKIVICYIFCHNNYFSKKYKLIQTLIKMAGNN